MWQEPGVTCATQGTFQPAYLWGFWLQVSPRSEASGMSELNKPKMVSLLQTLSEPLLCSSDSIRKGNSSQPLSLFNHGTLFSALVFLRTSAPQNTDREAFFQKDLKMPAGHHGLMPQSPNAGQRITHSRVAMQLITNTNSLATHQTSCLGMGPRKLDV